MTLPSQNKIDRPPLARRTWLIVTSILLANFLYAALNAQSSLQLFFLVLSFLALSIGLWSIAYRNRTTQGHYYDQLNLVLSATPSGIAIQTSNSLNPPQVSQRMRDIIGCGPEVSENDIIELLYMTYRRDQENRKPEDETTPAEIPHFKRQDGSIVWIEIDRKEIQSIGSSTKFEVYTVTDITDMQNAREDFLRKDTQMQFIFNSAPIGLHWSSERKDVNNGIVKERLVNPAHQAITGLSKEEMDIPGMFSAITHPQDAIRQHEERKLLINKETDRISIEKRYIRKDGTTVWVSASWVRKWDPDGIGYEEVSSMVDITALKQVSEDLKKKESQFRFIFESAPIGLLWSHAKVKNNGGGLEFMERLVNPAHTKITGLSREQSDVPNIFNTISRPDDIAVKEEGIRKNLDTGDGQFSMEKCYLRPDGKEAWVLITWLRRWVKYPYRYHELCTLVDITEQKRISEEIVLAKTAAEEANQAKTQFLATMSHEIRTPMNGLVGVLHIMESIPASDISKYIRIAQNSANDLLMLISDILDLSKIEAGKMVIEQQPFAIKDVVEHAAEVHANTAFEKGVELYSIMTPETTVSTTGDPHRLRQVLSNLISNAIKFTEEGSIEVGTKPTTTSSGRQAIEFYVKDSGIGIDEVTQKKLFQAFTQANASTTRKYGGTGLGLSICKSITHQMGGDIGVDSVPEEGSTFWVRIPFDQLDPVEELLTVPENIKFRNILMVEDHSEVINNIKQWLNLWQCELYTAATPEDGLAILRDESNQIDLVLIDSSVFDDTSTNWGLTFSKEDSLKNIKMVMLERMTINQLDQVPICIDERISKPLQLDNLKAILTGTPLAKPIQDDADSDWSSDLSHLNILLVDDNATNRRVTTKILSLKHQIEADNACDGLEAIEAMKKKKYDLVFMDCMMPVMDGYDATRMVRSDEKDTLNRETPIVAITANATPENREECLDAGMNDHIAKPLRPIAIKEALAKWIVKPEERVPTTTADTPSPQADHVEEKCIFNKESLVEVYEEDEEAINETLSLYLETTRSSMEELQAVIDGDQDISKIKFLAHGIRGNSAEIGAERLCAHTREFELMSKDGNLEAVLEKYPVVKKASEETFKELDSIIQGIQ